MTQVVRIALGMFAGVVLMSQFAGAQSATTAAIAGVARDATGAVLPGVTVEASSPALIEKVRTAVTDGQGQYKVVDLRPGTYTVTFALQGFNAFRREGIELSAGFTAAVNAEMKIGSVSETVVVTGASPVVDVQNSRTQQVIKAETLDALPTGTKSVMQFASITLGAVSAQAGRNDVGGDKGELNTGIVLHGGRGDDGRMNWDGMNANSPYGNGGGQYRSYFYNTVGVQEVSVDTGGNSAESETGGANINMVPKAGGNTFRFYGAASYTSSRFSAKSVSDDLVARGVAPQASVKQIYDYGAGVGGPIKSDRLWFYTAHRWWGSQSFAANNWFNKSTNPFVYDPDLARPAYTDSFFVDNGVRLTWQVNAKHKISQELHRQAGCTCWFQVPLLFAPEAAFSVPYGPQVLSQTTWSYPATNRLLIQGGALFLRQVNSFLTHYAETASRFTGGGPKKPPGANEFAVTDIGTGRTYNGIPASTIIPAVDDKGYNFNQQFSVAYVTGSHAFKAGVQLLQGDVQFPGLVAPIPNVHYILFNGTPVSVIQWAGPFEMHAKVNTTGLFAQDQWTIKRLTLNLGVRLDQIRGRTLAASEAAGPFVPAREVPAQDDFPNFKDINPRVGAAYDLFGNGKTSVKASFGRYVFSQGVALAQNFAPSYQVVTNVSRTWDDSNRDFVTNCQLTNPAANGECGPISDAAFGRPVQTLSIADDARVGWNKREFNYQTSLQVQHELRPGMALAVGYFHTTWGNLTVQQNTSVTAADFDQYCVTAPTDVRLGDSSGSQICGLYDIKPQKFGQVTTLITRAKHFGKPSELFNGVDIAFNSRWGNGAFLQGGVSLGRETVDYCYANEHPELLPEYFPNANYPRNEQFCRVTSSWWNGIGSQAKIQAVYPLPWGIQVSGTFKTLPGIIQTANLALTNAQVASSLGRNLSSCPAEGACSATVTVPLVPSGQTASATVSGALFDQRLNQTDLRLTKTFRYSRGRIQGMLDLYNAFNNRAPQTINSAYGSGWLTPTTLLGGRLLKFGAQIDF